MVSMTLLIEAFNQHEKEVLYRKLAENLGPQKPPTGPANGPDSDDSDESDLDCQEPRKSAKNGCKRPDGKDKKGSGPLPERFQREYESYQETYLSLNKSEQKFVREENKRRRADELEVLDVMNDYFPDIPLYQNEKFKTTDKLGNVRYGWVWAERIDVPDDILPILYWLGFQRAGRSKLVHKVGIEGKKAYSSTHKAANNLVRVA